MTSKIEPSNPNPSRELFLEQKKASETYARKVPKVRRGTYLKAARGIGSPRNAIKAQCDSCMGYEEVVPRVSECRIYSCPLWHYRPYQK